MRTSEMEVVISGAVVECNRASRTGEGAVAEADRPHHLPGAMRGPREEPSASLAVVPLVLKLEVGRTTIPSKSRRAVLSHSNASV